MQKPENEGGAETHGVLNMPKYKVYAIATASWLMGEYEAANGEEAMEKAEDDDQAESTARLCHQCSDVEIGDYHDLDVSET